MTGPDPAPSDRAGDRPPGGRPHLVVVSGDPDLRTFLHEGLQLTGFWVSSIASGLQAIEVLRLRRFDLIVLDGRLGGLSAGEVIRRIAGSADNGGRHDVAPVAIVDPADEDESQIRADLVLRPPLDLDLMSVDLLSVITRWRRRHPGVPWADAPSRVGRRPDGAADR